jgi:hypothetical protein
LHNKTIFDEKTQEKGKGGKITKEETKDKEKNIVESKKEAKLQYDNRTFLILCNF